MHQESQHFHLICAFCAVSCQIIAVGPGSLDEEGNRKPLVVTPGSTVLYSKYAGSEFKGADGSDYIALRENDIMAVLS